MTLYWHPKLRIQDQCYRIVHIFIRVHDLMMQHTATDVEGILIVTALNAATVTQDIYKCTALVYHYLIFRDENNQEELCHCNNEPTPKPFIELYFFPFSSTKNNFT